MNPTNEKSPIFEAFINRKGGVGKTTLSLQRALDHARKGRKTAYVDLDPQGNASFRTLKEDEIGRPVYEGVPAHMLFEKNYKPSFDQLEPNSKHPNLTVIYARSGDQYLESVDERRLDLMSLLQGIVDIAYDYDFEAVVIDAPPSAGRLQTAAVAIGGNIYVPSEIYVGENVGAIHSFIKKAVRSIPGSESEFKGVIVNKYEKKSIKEHETLEEIFDELGDKCIPNVIKNWIDIRRATELGCSIFDMKKANPEAVEVFEELFKTLDCRSGFIIDGGNKNDG